MNMDWNQIQNPALSPTGCVSLGKVLNLSVPLLETKTLNGDLEQDCHEDPKSCL